MMKDLLSESSSPAGGRAGRQGGGVNIHPHRYKPKVSRHDSRVTSCCETGTGEELSSESTVSLFWSSVISQNILSSDAFHLENQPELIYRWKGLFSEAKENNIH